MSKTNSVSEETSPRSEHGTVELGAVCLQLRDDLSFTLQRYGGQPCYVIEDEVAGRYYRVGLAEQTFMSLLDGRTPVRQVLARTAATLGREALNEHDAAMICKWLVESQLAHTDQARAAGRLYDTASQAAGRRVAQRLNPIMIKCPLGSPDRLLTGLTRWFGPLVSAGGLLVWLAVLATGGYQLLANWYRFRMSSAAVLDPHNWLWLGLTFLALKLLHETAHGVFCKKFGGRVREAGVVLILFIPLPYVDVTSSWRFVSKWHRFATAAAGMMIELLLAALAAIIWSQTEVGLVHQQAYNVIFIASVVTVLFNANFLMRFDGYYMLSDWLELPNLATHGSSYLQYVGRRYVLGVESRPPRWPEGKATAIRTYGVLALLWRVVVCASLVLGASLLLHGAGVVLAVAGVLLWVCWPLVQLMRYVTWGNDFSRPSIGRFAGVVALAGCLLAAVIFWVPWFLQVTAPVVVDYAPRTVLRSAAAGFVREIRVVPGQRVEAGQTLIVLENEDVALDAADLELAIRQSLQRSRAYRQRGRIADLQVEQSSRSALEKRLEERRGQLAGLTVVAPVAGRVVATDLAALQGRYVDAGTELLAIGDEGRKELQALIAQDDLEVVQSAGDLEVRARVWGSELGTFDGRMERVSPRASVVLPHPAFAATAGGPLAVRAQQERNGDDETTTSWELLEPRFQASIPLSAERSGLLRAGQRGTIKYRAREGTLGAHLYARLARWIGRRLGH